MIINSAFFVFIRVPHQPMGNLAGRPMKEGGSWLATKETWQV
ncbi:MAG: hypothetical protein ACNA8H_08365 [Anaerolineales bacterium]